ncbi:hypothetical protein AB0J99_23195, partial [Micromonospora echinaurantiaca]
TARRSGNPPGRRAVHAQRGGNLRPLGRRGCQSAEYRGRTLRAASEIAEVGWLGYADRHRVSPVDQLIFDHLWASAGLR